ncbi:MAG TPA: type Z 30S ribosomal protein S14 [Blastocatellia bacterium]|nr:type Z 30S ribosomal protein S14 [Blastocatellia bacterium]
MFKAGELKRRLANAQTRLKAAYGSAGKRARKKARQDEMNLNVFVARVHNRCRRCGRGRGYLRKFQLCRICFRNLALEGHIPGVTKSSW